MMNNIVFVVLLWNIFKDLGVILSSKLTYSFDTGDVVNRVNRMLGFASGQLVDLSDVKSLYILYSSLVRTLIEN